MDYVTATQARTLAALKQRNGALLGKVTRTEHARSVARRDALHFWIALVLSLVVGAAIWIYLQLHALRILYKKEYDWWGTHYAQGPRPAGQYHFKLTCVCLAAEYPPFAALTCGTLPQSSAIFLLTMIQHFGQHMEGIHYSGDRAQLRGASFHSFLKSYTTWNVPENVWRFLYPTKARFDLSTAVQKARSLPTGGSILESLYNGGLCQAAVDFYKPETSAMALCHMLLDTELVYYQACGASKLSAALRNGSSVGSAAGGIAGGALARGVYAARSGISYGANAVRMTVSASDTEVFIAGGTVDAATDAAATSAATAEEGIAAAACAAAGPFYAVCLAASSASIWASVAAVIVTTALMTGLTTAATTGALYATMPCPTGNYYTLAMQSDGSYKRVEWDGDATDLPPRVKNN